MTTPPGAFAQNSKLKIMKESDKKQEPILVQDPYTGRFVNILPLFKLVHEIQIDDGFGSIVNDIDRVIRIFSLSMPIGNEEVNGRDFSNSLCSLYNLKDAFDAITEYKSTKD